MGKINWARVFLGGLLAGVVITIFEMGYGMLMAADWQAALQALGRPAEPTSSQMIIFPLLNFAIGFAAIWLYVAARPRFGPGPKTAACMGSACGVIVYAIPGIAWGMLIGFPTRLLVIGIVWGVVQLVVATVAGAWAYKEV
ncbi:MAG: hypothetical protein ACE5MH_04635 [Terriglobia bacterium]